MDCNTARLLLEFARRRAAELDAAERAALDNHLLHCRSCAALAGAERRADEALGRAMRAVEVPPGLKKMILDRAAAAREDAERRRFKRRLRAMAAAAALLLCGGAIWYWVSLPRVLDLVAFRQDVHDQEISPRDRETLTAAFKSQFGIDTVLPDDLNYLLLTGIAVGKVQGQTVPLLFFNRTGREGENAYALVYVLSDRQFDLKGVAATDPDPQGYRHKVDVVVHPNGRYAYLIVYTGNDLRWLRKELQSL
jgi:hypothetical protein